MAVALAEEASSSLYSKVAWRIMPFLILCYVVAFIDRTNIGVAQLAFIKDLHFNAAIYGFGGGMFYLGYVLFEIPSNLFLLKMGARRTLFTIMILWGLACMTLALITSPISFYLVRFLLGSAEAGLFPGILLYLTYWIPIKRRARFTALFMMAIPLAGIIGSPLAGWIMHSFDGANSLTGWQWLFLVEGAPAVVLGIVAYFYLDNGPQAATWLDESERGRLLTDISSDESATGNETHGSVALVIGNTTVYVLAVFGSSLLISTAGAFLWLPDIIHSSGVTDILEVGLLTALPFVVGVIAQYLISQNSDRTGERRWHAVLPGFVGAIGWALLPLAGTNTALSMIFQTVAISGTLGAMGPFWTLPGLLLRGPAIAVGIALVSTVAGLGNFISPVIVGELNLLTRSHSAGQLFFAALLLTGAAALALFTNAAQFERRD